MELSMCTTFAKDKTLEEIIGLVKRLNIKAVEIWSGHIEDFLKRNCCTIKELKEYLNKNEIFCSAISPYFDFLDKSTVKKSIAEAECVAEYADELECRVIRTFIGRKPSKELCACDWERCIQALRHVTSGVKGSDVCFAIETHNGQPSDTAESILYMLERTNTHNLKVLFDGFNFYIDSIDMMKEYKKLKNEVIHYHLKNYIWKDRLPVALDRGDVDFTDIIKDAVKDKCCMSFEYFCDDPSRLITDSVNWIKKLK